MKTFKEINRDNRLQWYDILNLIEQRAGTNLVVESPEQCKEYDRLIIEIKGGIDKIVEILEMQRLSFLNKVYIEDMYVYPQEVRD